MARPKKTVAIEATATIGIRVTQLMRRAIENEASKSGRTLTEEVRTLLDEALARRERGKTRPVHMEKA